VILRKGTFLCWLFYRFWRHQRRWHVRIYWWAIKQNPHQTIAEKRLRFLRFALNRKAWRIGLGDNRTIRLIGRLR
jgi:hypothetical protein